MSRLPVWIASGNADKARELATIVEAVLPFLSPVHSRGPRDVEENETTYIGNARLKARALASELRAEGHRRFSVLGDDSGLSVDLLQGRPGVHSARYSGAQATPRKNLDKLLRELDGITLDLARRTGRYHCALYLIVVEDGRIVAERAAEGTREGLIATEPQGANGYAYDPVFLDPHTLQSYGDVSYEEKQRDSHRRRAFEALRARLETFPEAR